jgi:hypothetical protein
MNTRNLLAVAAGMLLSVALFAFSGFSELRFAGVDSALAHAGDRGKATTPEDADRILAVLEQSRLRARLLYRPLIACAVGLLVGAIASRAQRLMAALAVVPFAVTVAAQESWRPISALLIGCYVALALISASLVARQKGPGWSRPQKP